jgi:predicted nuclease of predicted toxin-antitoxin system
VRFLVDECLSLRVADLLTTAGHDAVHVATEGLAGEPDEVVLGHAQVEARVLLSADTDFGEILSRTRSQTPSVVLFRRGDRTATGIATVLLDNLDLIEDDLNKGAFVVIAEERLRIRALPVR